MDAIYLRISDDTDGLEAGVDRQREDCLADAKAAGVEIPEHMIFMDNDISASTLSKKPRPEWNRLVTKIEAGEVTRVWAWSFDRLTRRVREGEDLIDLHNTCGVEWYTRHGKEDLSTAEGRERARGAAVRSAGEAERISERVTRQKKQRAMQGKPQGGRTRLYGYTSRWKVVPSEAKVIKEAFQRRTSGESINSIAEDFKARGLTTAEFTCKWHTERFEVSGKERPPGVSETRAGCDKCRPGRLWKSGTLLTTLRNPTYAGLRSYKGEVVGPMQDGFPAIIDVAVFDAAQAVTAEKPRSLNTRRYLLSGFARCGICMGRMSGRPAANRALRYRCSSSQGGCGVLSIRCDWIDEPVYSAVASYEIAERHNAGSEDDGNEALQEADIEVARLKAELNDIQFAVIDGTIRAASAIPMVSALETQIGAAQSVQRKAVVKSAQDHRTLRTYSELLNLSLGEKRALLDKHLDLVRIDPAPTKGRNSVDLGRVELHFKAGEVVRLSNTVEAQPS